jgi:hypothetical protein
MLGKRHGAQGRNPNDSDFSKTYVQVRANNAPLNGKGNFWALPHPALANNADLPMVPAPQLLPNIVQRDIAAAAERGRS